ncbi:MAG: hypothetical protein LBK59_02770 [Bifidobacteriaceae bacterium]|nr:hypothetical protein [Bifidobacteriaceae bacterium]
MSELTAAQVHLLLTATDEYVHSAEQAVKARDRLDRALLDTARQARVGLRLLAAVTGLHHAAVRAGIRRAVGPGRPGSWSQPTLTEACASQPVRTQSPPRPVFVTSAYLTPVVVPDPLSL